MSRPKPAKPQPVPISMKVPSDLLAAIDAAARAARQSRTAYLLSAAEARIEREAKGEPK